MTAIGILTPSDPMYEQVSVFARDVYLKKLKAIIDARPDAFSYATENDRVIGCFGLYRARIGVPLLLETYHPDAFERIAGVTDVERRLCAEMGTRAVATIGNRRSNEVSLLLSARLIVHAEEIGIRYLAFTSNPSVRAIAAALDIDLVELGEPDLSRKDDVFLANWKEFFKIKQICYGFRIGSTATCRRVLEGIAKR